MKPTLQPIAALSAAGLVLACPAYAQDETPAEDPLNAVVQIESDEGTIIAEYSGTTKIISRTLGANRVVQRADPYRCTYSVDLEVARVATLGEEAEARRDMTSRNVIRGAVAGRCSSSATDKEIAREIERRDSAFELALENLIRRDRDDVVAEVGAQVAVEDDE